MTYLLISPDADLDYSEDWSNWLDTGVTITTSTWTIFPLGPTLDGQIDTATKSTIFVSGCTLGVVYLLTNNIVTSFSTAQTAERTIALRCEER